MSRIIPYLNALSLTIPFFKTSSWTKPYLNILSRTLPYLNTLKRTIHYLNTLSRTLPYLNTLSRTIHYLDTLLSAANQIRVLRHLANKNQVLRHPRALSYGWTPFRLSARVVFKTSVHQPSPNPVWSAHYSPTCILCKSNSTNWSIVENVFLNELVLSGRNGESLCKSFQIVELHRSVGRHVHSFI